jgi:hypothetical protein
LQLEVARAFSGTAKVGVTQQDWPAKAKIICKIEVEIVALTIG